MRAGLRDVHDSGAFRHEALFYSGEREFVERTSSFIRDSIESDEPIWVVVSRRKIDLLRTELGETNGRVMFADMARIGMNPARIIPAWQDFIDERGAEGRCRGIGEPIWDGQAADELVESQIHEALLNVAFEGGPSWWLICPYDTSALRPDVIEEARRSHPFVYDGDERKNSSGYRALASTGSAFDWPLPKAPAGAVEMVFSGDDLEALRHFVSELANQVGLLADQVDDFVLVVNEIATNSLKYGGGGGLLRLWRDVDAIVCEVGDAGNIDQPLAGRLRPTGELEGGMGLWLANQICDLVQVRSFPTGSVVRVRMSL